MTIEKISTLLRIEYRTFGFRCPACRKGQVSVFFPWPLGPWDLRMGRVRIIHADGSKRSHEEQIEHCGLSVDLEVVADIARNLHLQAEAGIKRDVPELLLRRAVKTAKRKKS